MTVRELITLLLNEPLDNEVRDRYGYPITGKCEPFMGMELNKTYLESESK